MFNLFKFIFENCKLSFVHYSAQLQFKKNYSLYTQHYMWFSSVHLKKIKNKRVLLTFNYMPTYRRFIDVIL